jgi:DNA-binding beta-propeller fold protein YncE
LKQTLLAGAALLALAAVPAQAQLVASANDSKARLINGMTVIAASPPADTVTVFDFSVTPPRQVAEVEAPVSVVGPPSSVTLTPDERLVLVTANQRIDPANDTRTVPHNVLSVIDLRATPPAVVQTLETGRGPAGIAVNRAGTLALVANREAGSVSVFRIRDGRLEAVGTVEIGPAATGVSAVSFTPDGRHALVTRDGDFFIHVLAINGENVTRTNRTISAGLRPYGIGIAPDGSWAAVANIGRGGGDEDTISLISLRGDPGTWRVVHTLTVGQTPEGITVSPDGKVVAVTVMNGSNKAENSPFRGPGLVRTYRVENMRFVPAGEGRVGTWSQGAVFNTSGRMMMVGNMVEQSLNLFSVAEDGALAPVGQALPLPGGSAALGSAPR